MKTNMQMERERSNILQWCVLELHLSCKEVAQKRVDHHVSISQIAPLQNSGIVAVENGKKNTTGPVKTLW